jgi:hypothetical protein
MTQMDDQAGEPAAAEQASGEHLRSRSPGSCWNGRRRRGVSLVGRGGLLAGVTKTVLQADAGRGNDRAPSCLPRHDSPGPAFLRMEGGLALAGAWARAAVRETRQLRPGSGSGRRRRSA